MDIEFQGGNEKVEIVEYWKTDNMMNNLRDPPSMTETPCSADKTASLDMTIHYLPVLKISLKSSCAVVMGLIP